MITKSLVTAMLALIPVYGRDRTPELADAKAEQLAAVSVAMASAVESQKKWPGTKQELAAMLAAWGSHETHYSLAVGRFECARYQCDPHPKTKLPQSVSFWQLKVGACSSPAAWEAAKTDFDVAAREATRAIVRARWQCRSLEQGGNWTRLVFSALSGRGCASSLPGLDARVATYNRLIARAW